MTLRTWSRLSAAEQELLLLSLNPYEGWPFLKAVERAFRRRFGAQPGVDRVFCGFVDHWGAVVGISVSIRPGQARTRSVPSGSTGRTQRHRGVRALTRGRSRSSLPSVHSPPHQATGPTAAGIPYTGPAPGARPSSGATPRPGPTRRAHRSKARHTPGRQPVREPAPSDPSGRYGNRSAQPGGLYKADTCALPQISAGYKL